LFFHYHVLYMLHIYIDFFLFCFCSENIPMVHNIGVIALRINWWKMVYRLSNQFFNFFRTRSNSAFCGTKRSILEVFLKVVFWSWLDSSFWTLLYHRPISFSYESTLASARVWGDKLNWEWTRASAREWVRMC
jgi:hypothetical protein